MTNRLIYGDNLKALKLIPDKSVKLIYIDPPFNTNKNQNIMHMDGSNNAQFTDVWKNIYTYIAYMKERIVELYRILSDDGSLYIHCDQHADAYLRVLCDELFGYNMYRTRIIWRRASNTKNAKNIYINNTDTILYYTKSNTFTFNTQYNSLTEKQIDRDYKLEPETNRYFLTSGFECKQGCKELYFKDRNITIKSHDGRGFKWSQETLNKRIDENKYAIYWTKTNTPRIKTYLDQNKGVQLDNLWTDIPPLSSNSKEREEYPTQKPEALLERIIKISSNPHDLMLDAFCGSGTTLAVCKKLDREYIGIDNSIDAIEITMKRIDFSMENLEIL